MPTITLPNFFKNDGNSARGKRSHFNGEDSDCLSSSKTGEFRSARYFY